MGQNRISGTIPTEIGNMVQLTQFAAYNNGISGTMPTEIGKLVKLLLLYAQNNRINGYQRKLEIYVG